MNSQPRYVSPNILEKFQKQITLVYLSIILVDLRITLVNTSAQVAYNEHYTQWHSGVIEERAEKRHKVRLGQKHKLAQIQICQFCQYLSVFVSICNYLSVFVSISQYF